MVLELVHVWKQLCQHLYIIYGLMRSDLARKDGLGCLKCFQLGLTNGCTSLAVLFVLQHVPSGASCCVRVLVTCTCKQVFVNIEGVPCISFSSLSLVPCSSCQLRCAIYSCTPSLSAYRALAQPEQTVDAVQGGKQQQQQQSASAKG